MKLKIRISIISKSAVLSPPFKDVSFYDLPFWYSRDENPFIFAQPPDSGTTVTAYFLQKKVK